MPLVSFKHCIAAILALSAFGALWLHQYEAPVRALMPGGMLP